MRPASIILFERIYAVVIVLNLALSVWALSRAGAIMPADAPEQARAMVPWIAGFGAIVWLAVALCLLYFIARRGSDVARWIYVIFFAIGLLSLLFNLTKMPAGLLSATMLPTLVLMAVRAVCVWLLFRPDAKPWFDRRTPPSSLQDTFQ